MLRIQQAAHHLGSIPEIIGGTGFTLLVLTGLALLERYAAPLLAPFKTMGKTPLTYYVAHVVGFLMLMITETTAPSLVLCIVFSSSSRWSLLQCSSTSSAAAHWKPCCTLQQTGLGSTTEQVNDFVDRPALNQHAYSGEEWHISATFKECDEGTTNRDLADLQ